MPIYSGPGKKMEYEQVKIDEFIDTVIEKVEFRENQPQTFTNNEGKKETRNVNQVRFKFKLTGYEYPHYSRWMTNIMSEKSNLYKILVQLYGVGMQPDCYVNLSKLEGSKVSTRWDQVPMSNGGMFQFPDKVKPIGDLPGLLVDEAEVQDPNEPLNEPAENSDGEEIPF